MTKSRVFLFIIIVASSILLYLLPRYVVNNDSTEIASQEMEDPMAVPGMEQGHDHSFDIPDSLNAKLESLYDSYKNADIQEKRFIFADSLAEAYKTVGKLDSSAKYLEVRAVEDPSIENLITAGNGYYEAFNFAVDQSRRNKLAEKARGYFERILNEDPEMLDVKSKLAMTYVASPQPMTGITMLREVLEKDPDNELAIYNLGILAITSGQLDRALERFEKLRELDPDNPEANFYVGYCLFEMGKQEESVPYFEKVKSLDINGDLVLMSEDYLKRINK